LPAAAQEEGRFTRFDVVNVIERWVAAVYSNDFMPVLVGWSKQPGAHESVLSAVWAVAQSVEPEGEAPLRGELLRALERTRALVGDAALLLEIQNELVSWALGYSDPVLVRVQGREAALS